MGEECITYSMLGLFTRAQVTLQSTLQRLLLLEQNKLQACAVSELEKNSWLSVLFVFCMGFYRENTDILQMFVILDTVNQLMKYVGY